MAYINGARRYEADARGKYRGNGAAVLLMFGPSTNYDFNEGISISWDYQNETLASLLKKYKGISILAGFDRVSRNIEKILEKIAANALKKIKPPENLEGFTTVQ